MPAINTNYNFPVPPENVYGQTVAGPSVENSQQTENQQNTNKTQQPESSTEGKGQHIDTYA